MARVFRLPDLGEGLTEAVLVRWLVATGDKVRIDQPIAEVETAKSAVELPSPFAGTIAVLHGSEGDTIAVGAPLLEVADVADAAAGSGSSSPPAERAADHREEERAGSGNVLIGYGTSDHSAGGRRRRPTRAPGSAVATAVAPSAAPTVGGPVAVRSPIVRRLAQSRGLDLRSVPATGADGAITRGDVLRALDTAPTVSTGSAAAPPDLRITSREPLGMLRKTVGAKLSRSRAEIPEATVWVDVDATELWALRGGMSVDGRAPSLTAILAKYVLLALAEYPVLAGRLSDDGAEILQFDGVNLGIAADTPRGLLVPVLRHAERHSIAQLDVGLRRLAAEARAGSLAPADLTGSTFTLNNYGSLGVDGSAAIINHPEVAILGVGRMMERAWVVDGAIVPRRITQLSLVFDHRVCDGGYAAGFLRSIVEAIEHPARLYAQL